ncbi:LysR family transcriptional regulator [Bradyrhizobium sp. URHD0069]|jgi:DNA-binding transcriptional LysR family regulator|uniref:LysR family transcriptional regulator n=1 Tax=Bradyrhizobium sp. URHD0069 TaxID=1380355 RepID=UPI0009DE2A81|nr:LysR family transcriptional regulator [Bradyrhizobium sp. URHD0069]
MTLEQLRIFIAVAELQHVTRAAQNLNLTQSTVSSAIQALETRHNVRLFDRVGRRIELTRAGKSFLAEARDVVIRTRNAEQFLDQFGDLSRGVLAVHASQTIASYWLVPHLVRFKRQYPGIEIQMGIANTAQVADAVASGQADLGFTEGAIDNDALSEETIAQDRMLLVFGSTSRWATLPMKAIPDLLELDWVLREPGSGTRSVFETALTDAKIDKSQLRIAFEFSSNEAVRTAVETGAGATMISELVVASRIEAGVLSKSDLLQPCRHFKLVRHRDRHPPPVVTAFTKMLQAKTSSLLKPRE